MPDLPLLIFPEPTTSSREKLSGGPTNLHFPNRQRQIDRVSPMFLTLQEAFEKRRVEILQGAAGVDPEQVIVFETIGSVEEFTKSVSRIEGLEWMGEMDIDEIEPDEDFFDEDHVDRELTGRLYLVMSNQRALQEMLSLWEMIKGDESLSFRRGELRGLSKFKEVFLHLKDIRRWGIQDRLHETHVIEYWEESLHAFPDQPIKFEIELWHRRSPEARAYSIEEVSNLITAKGGRVISQCAIGEIAYNAILAELPPQEISNILANSNTELVRSDSVMFFRPTGQMIVEPGEFEAENEILEMEGRPLPTLPPVAGILDGLPLSNHQFLANRLIIDDPDEWEHSYLAAKRKHGTAMASLVIHGDLNQESSPLRSSVYIRPIFQPNPRDFLNNTESIPENILVVDLIHRAIKRMFDGEGAGSPTAPSVKVINLSLGDPYRHFFQIVSPLGRLIDWLSNKYKILFIISSGNHTQSISLPLSSTEFENLNPLHKEELIFKSILGDFRNRRLISPAESINAITVGGVHQDTSEFNLNYRINPYQGTLPSVTNPIGGGLKRSIKPDIILEAGKQLLRTPIQPTNPYELNIVSNYSAPGLKVAVPSIHGDLTESNYCRGSSNSAALTTRSAVLCYENLISILENQYQEGDFSEFDTCLLKALLIHGASWGEIGSRISDILSDVNDQKEKKKLIGRIIGYGYPDFQKSLFCTEQRATVLGFGTLRQEEAHMFEFPLPPSLGSVAVRRKVTVTLAFFSPVVPGNMKYRHSNLWFSLDNDTIVQTRVDADHHAVRRGTIQHEIFEGGRATPFEDGYCLRIKVNCKPDAVIDGEMRIPYGLIVSLEVAEGINIPIYNEVRTRIATAIQIQQQT